MDHYIEIKILPDPEFPATTLMNALSNKLHKALVDLRSNSIGVSFPDYGKTLGQRLRLHGAQQKLNELENCDWIGRMKDYCQSSAVLPVPEGIKHRTVSRQQDNMSEANLRRLIKRGSIDSAEVEAYKYKMVEQYQKGPYLELQSSKGGRYRRYIVLGDLVDKEVVGEFNQFGLSKTATIPWF